MTTKKKLPYEPPVIIDLSGNVAYAKPNCTNGQTATGACGSGSQFSGSTDCLAGGSPASACLQGATATTGECKPGNYASDLCLAGSSAPTSACQKGSAASTECLSGTVAGSTCQRGSAAVGTCNRGTTVV